VNPEGQSKDHRHKKKTMKINAYFFLLAMLLLPLLIQIAANPEGQRKDHRREKKSTKINA